MALCRGREGDWELLSGYAFQLGSEVVRDQLSFNSLVETAKAFMQIAWHATAVYITAWPDMIAKSLLGF